MKEQLQSPLPVPVHTHRHNSECSPYSHEKRNHVSVYFWGHTDKWRNLSPQPAGVPLTVFFYILGRPYDGWCCQNQALLTPHGGGWVRFLSDGILTLSAWELASHQPLPRSQMPANSPPPVPMIAISCVCLNPLSIKLGRKLFGLNFHITVHHRGNRIGTQGRNLNQKP